MKNKKKVNAKAVQKEVEKELSEDSLGQVAGGSMMQVEVKVKSVPELPPQGHVWERWRRETYGNSSLPSSMVHSVPIDIK